MSLLPSVQALAMPRWDYRKTIERPIGPVLFNGRVPADPPYRVCVICSGNICRSPMGAVILTSMLADAGLGARVVVDSAGTGGWHEGDGADPRTVRALKDHGYDGSAHRAREFRNEWFSDRDLIVVADAGHLSDLRRRAPDADASAKVRLLRELDPTAVEAGTLEVDDPYFGDAQDFERCLAVVERACRGLVEHVRAQLVQPAAGSERPEPGGSPS
ncbi:MAG: low molecular weight protein-tyrosine-phosphatase [Dermatophilaceae bacterium]